MEEFYIDPSYITDVPIHEKYYIAKDPENPTPKEILEILKLGYSYVESFSSKDHPEFEKLRNKLEDLGFIKTERNWWNGDRVLKPFKLNSMQFLPRDKFCCAAALRIQFAMLSK